MLRRALQCVLLLSCCFVTALVLPASRTSVLRRSQSELPKLKLANRDCGNQDYGRLPLSFEPNHGQTDRRVKFLARERGCTLFLTSTEMVLSLPAESMTRRMEKRGRAQRVNEIRNPLERLRSLLPRTPEPPGGIAGPNIVRIRLEGTDSNVTTVGLEELPGRVNYFIGSDPKKWHKDIPVYTRVKYKNLYPGIDLVHYGNQGQLEHDFIVAPGADPNAICFSVEGDENVKVDARGNLLLDEGGNLLLQRPRIYQDRGGVRAERAGSYVLKNNHQVGFMVKEYDARLPLVIDPVLSYSTYLGGTREEQPGRIAVDSSGSVYTTGTTLSVDFPTASSFQAKGSGYSDAYVAKLNPSGDALVYATYLGGRKDEEAYEIAVDASGSAYVIGDTESTDFPAANPVQSNFGGFWDAFVTKLSPSGNALVYSSYLGGSNDEYGLSIAVDAAGNAYMTGRTSSANFPTANPFQANSGGGWDAFITKLNPSGSALVYSTYLGGSGSDGGTEIAVDSSGSTYLSGATASTDFPTASPIQPNYGGGEADAFVTRLNPSGNALVYSTYLGGSGGDASAGIAIDSSGNASVSGITVSTNFPSARPIQANYGGGGSDAFVTKLNSLGSALVYSTYLGGSSDDAVIGIAMDSSGNVYVSGITASTDFPTASPVQANYGGGQGDAFVAKLNSSGNTLVYSTYLGGSSGDSGLGIAIDSPGNVYVLGITASANFPTVDPFQANSRGNYDAFVAKIVDLRPTLEITLPSGAAISRSTAGIGSSTQVGYAAATVASGTSPYGVAVFSFRQNGVVVSEAAVPASPPTTSARIFVDYRSAVPAVPGRSDAGWVDINTGLAIVNRGAATANVTYTLRSKTGTPIATGHGKLAGGAHFARFVHQLKEVVPDFNIPGDFSTTTQFGSLDVASDQPLSVLALRLTINQRNQTLLTSTPVADTTKPLGNQPLYFPQYVDGGGYLTTLILLNTSATPETGKLFLFDDGGAPLVVNQVGGTRDSTFSYSIQPGGAFVFETDGSPVDANAGSVQLIPDTGTPSPVGTGVFSFLQGGIRVTESGIPSASPTTHARIYIDQSGGHGTGLAIASPGNSAVSVILKAFNTDGTTPAGTGAEVTLNGSGHTARFVSELIPDLPANFRGVLDISSLSPFVALTLRSLNNSRGDFLLTTFPIADARQPAPEPIVFPQIADGGGYTTEFIFLSPSGTSGLTLGFYGEDGAALAIGK